MMGPLQPPVKEADAAFKDEKDAEVSSTKGESKQTQATTSRRWRTLYWECEVTSGDCEITNQKVVNEGKYAVKAATAGDVWRVL